MGACWAFWSASDVDDTLVPYAIDTDNTRLVYQGNAIDFNADSLNPVFLKTFNSSALTIESRMVSFANASAGEQCWISLIGQDEIAKVGLYNNAGTVQCIFYAGGSGAIGPQPTCTAPKYFKLVKSETTVEAFYGDSTNNMTLFGTTTLAIPDDGTYYAGFDCASDANSDFTSSFDSITFSAAATDPGEQY